MWVIFDFYKIPLSDRILKLGSEIGNGLVRGEGKKSLNAVLGLIWLSRPYFGRLRGV